MESKKLIILCAILIVIVASICGAYILIHTQQEDTIIEIISELSLNNGENITLILTTENGTPISNQQVDVTIIDTNDERNILNLITDEEGIATFELNDVAAGTYSLECIYAGNNEYKPSNYTSILEIKEAEPQDPHPDWVCEGSNWYSVQLSEGHYGIFDKESGRMIGTGDMPDRHGYHEPGYVEKYSSTVKYRKNGEYYD